MKIIEINGNVYMGGLATSSSAQTSYICLTSGQLIAVAVAQNCATSSANFKHDIKDFKGSALSLVKQMRPRTFVYNPGDLRPELQDSSMHLGFIAEEVAKVNPAFAQYDDKGKPHGLQDDAILATAIKAIQEMQAEIDELKKELRRSGN